MNAQEAAAWELDQFFRALGLPYGDIEGVVYRQRRALDVTTIRRWLRAFAELLDNPEIIERFERPWRRIQPGT
jgi:hypothetical protein